MSKLVAETEAALSRAQSLGEQKRREPTKLVPNGDPLGGARPSDNAIAWDIVEPDSLGG
jgi:hypothetical protein